MTENFTYGLCIDLCEKLTTNPDDKDDEVIFIDSDTIDITEIIENNIILALPVKRLCKEDCKGLCLRCGSNLNFTTCNCDKDNTDPRLSKLKDLFSKIKEVLPWEIQLEDSQKVEETREEHKLLN